MRITTLCDDRQCHPAFRASPGFSCWIEAGHQRILFDTGVHGDTLLHNMEKLGIGPAQIDIILLSHIDSDHVGGLFAILERKGTATIYLPSSFPLSFKDRVKSYGAEVVEVSEPLPIADGVSSTGELGSWIKEQSLIVKGDAGNTIVVGCGHPGVVTIVKRAREIVSGRIYLVLGGFHSGAPSETASIAQSLMHLEVERVAPCHCTSEHTRGLLREKYRGHFIENGAGKTIEV